jgi:hypothetical protein
MGAAAFDKPQVHREPLPVDGILRRGRACHEGGKDGEGGGAHHMPTADANMSSADFSAAAKFAAA